MVNLNTLITAIEVRVTPFTSVESTIDVSLRTIKKIVRSPNSPKSDLRNYADLMQTCQNHLSKYEGGRFFGYFSGIAAHADLEFRSAIGYFDDLEDLY